MATISQESFEKFTEEEKKEIRRRYNWYQEKEVEEAILEFEDLFGKENLQPVPKIRVWDDVVKQNPYFKDDIDKLEHDILYSWNKLREKLIACYKIAKLIEFGYGGVVAKKEWKLSSSYMAENSIWSIVCQYKDEPIETEIDIIPVWSQPRLLSFHTRQQAEEFISYPENVELVRQYYML